MNPPITPGTQITGFWRGAFGRDSYGEKTVVESGYWRDDVWIVVEERGVLNFGCVSPESVSELLEDGWS